MNEGRPGAVSGLTSKKELVMRHPKFKQRGSMSLLYMFVLVVLGIGGVFFFVLTRKENTAEDHTIRAQFSCENRRDQTDFDRLSGAASSVLARDKNEASAACKLEAQASQAERTVQQHQADAPKTVLRAMNSFRANPGK